MAPAADAKYRPAQAGTSMTDTQCLDGDIIESMAGQIAAELEPDDWIAEARRYARPKVVAEGWSDAEIDRLIKQAQQDVEPDLR